MRPVHGVEIGVVGQAVEQRVDGREAVDLVLGQLLEHGRQVARIRDQDVFAAGAHAQHHVHGEGEDVVQRQGAHIHRLHAGLHAGHGRTVPGLGLQHVGNHIAVQQHGALGNPRGPAGVLQHGHIVGFDVRAFQRGARAACHGVVETHGTRQVEGRHHLLDIAHHIVDQGTLEQAQLVAHGAQHHMLDRRGRNALLQRVGKVFDDDDGLGAGVLELVLQFARGIQRIDIDHDKTRTQDGGDRHRVLRHIGHHDRHAVALGQPQALQVGAKSNGQAVGLAERDVLAHEAVGHLVAVFLEALFHQAHQRGVLRGVYVRRDARRIGFEPRTVQGSCVHACLLHCC